MKVSELERTIDRIDIMLDNSRLNSSQEDSLMEIREVIMSHLTEGVFQSKGLDKAMKKLKRLL